MCNQLFHCRGMLKNLTEIQNFDASYKNVENSVPEFRRQWKQLKNISVS